MPLWEGLFFPPAALKLAWNQFFHPFPRNPDLSHFQGLLARKSDFCSFFRDLVRFPPNHPLSSGISGKSDEIQPDFDRKALKSQVFRDFRGDFWRKGWILGLWGGKPRDPAKRDPEGSEITFLGDLGDFRVPESGFPDKMAKSDILHRFPQTACSPERIPKLSQGRGPVLRDHPAGAGC